MPKILIILTVAAVCLDCERLQSLAQEHMKSASDCAMQAAESKHPFYVAYDMPGLTVGDTAGTLYFVQAEQPQNAEPGARAPMQSEPCPSQLGVARFQSGLASSGQ